MSAADKAELNDWHQNHASVGAENIMCQNACLAEYLATKTVEIFQLFLSSAFLLLFYFAFVIFIYLF